MSPPPLDYRSDEDFWYNLPANFDVIQAIYRVFEWTGDADYLNDPVFLDFYRHSLTDYVEAWDSDADGFMESPPENGIRGIPTYWEGEGPRALTGADLVAAQFAANRAFARILALRGDEREGESFEAAARRLEEIGGFIHGYRAHHFLPHGDSTPSLPGGGRDQIKAHR